MRRVVTIIFITTVLTVVSTIGLFAAVNGEYMPLVPLGLAAAVLLPIPFIRVPYFVSCVQRHGRLRVLSWIVPLLALFALLLFLTGGNIAFTLLFMAPIPVVGFLVIIFRSNRYAGRGRGMVVITYLGQAMRMNLPLPRMLATAERSETGAIASRLRDVRARIESGSTLTEALSAGVHELPLRSLGRISAAERIARVPQTLDRLIREDRNRPIDDTAQAAFFAVYPVVVSFSVFVIVTMIMIFVMPKFEQIFKDFNTELPPVTILLLNVSRFVSDYLVMLLLLAGALAIPTFVPARYRRSGRWPRLGWEYVTRHRDLADASTVVADALEAGLTFDAALRSAGELPINQRLRWKLYRWAGGIEQGMSTADAARRAKMPNLVIGLSAVADVTAAGPAFRFLARYYNARFSRLEQLARGAALPALVFFFAGIVGTVEVGLFMPMISLIETVSHFQHHL